WRMERFVVVLLLASLVAAKPHHGRVVGGEDADPHEFPYQVSLQWNFNNGETKNFHFCGGSIINENWILTAAHCHTQVSEGGFIEVVAGEYNLSHENGTEQVRRAVSFLGHPKYGGNVGPFDIAVIKVEPPFEFNEFVQPVKLPVAGSVPKGDAYLSGWGSTSRDFGPIYPDILQKAKLPIIPLATCRKHQGQKVHESNVCAGHLDGTSSACSGDSGGPLVQRASDGSSVQIGIVSWGSIPCAGINKPAVFTKVSYFNDWIEESIHA
ncbi:serine protease, partial [Phocaeicola vulgatus]